MPQRCYLLKHCIAPVLTECGSAANAAEECRGACAHMLRNCLMLLDACAMLEVLPLMEFESRELELVRIMHCMCGICK